MKFVHVNSTFLSQPTRLKNLCRSSFLFQVLTVCFVNRRERLCVLHRSSKMRRPRFVTQSALRDAQHLNASQFIPIVDLFQHPANAPVSLVDSDSLAARRLGKVNQFGVAARAHFRGHVLVEEHCDASSRHVFEKLFFRNRRVALHRARKESVPKKHKALCLLLTTQFAHALELESERISFVRCHG